MGAWVLFSFLYLLKSVQGLGNIISHQCVVQFGSAHCTQHQMYHRPSQTCALYNWMATAFRSIVNSHWVNTQTELWNLSAIIEKQKNNKLCMWHHREWVAVVCWFFFFCYICYVHDSITVLYTRDALVCVCVLASFFVLIWMYVAGAGTEALGTAIAGGCTCDCLLQCIRIISNRKCRARTITGEVYGDRKRQRLLCCDWLHRRMKS